MNAMFKTYGRSIMTLTIFDWVVLIAICLDLKYFKNIEGDKDNKIEERKARENKRRLSGRIETTTMLR
jgi:hypothetical protein